MMQIAWFLGQPSILKTCRSFEQLVHRTIFTAEQLSVDKYVRDRERFKMSLQAGSSEMKRTNFKKRLEYKTVAPNLIVNDLTQFLHLINDTSDDFALLEKALNKFKNTDIDNVRKVSIGSILMRMLHHFQNNELASKFYNDQILRKNYLSSKHCLLLFFDLLFKQEQYAEFLRHFQELREQLDAKQQTITRSIFILVFATLYSQNTDKSFDYAKQLNDQYKDLHITQDHLVFLSALALNQNNPHIAEEQLLTLWPSAHQAIPTLRLIALIRMHKFVDALQVLRSLLLVYDESRTEKDDVVSSEAIDEAEKMFDECCNDDRLRADFKQLRDNLKTHGYITDKNVRSMVHEPFRSGKMTTLQSNKMYLQAEFNRNHHFR
ncbi:uncharacterized protein LOC129575838 [Sitodiplosis mosellana]|uniref:uncharacterized protein LOC129575838 n=1 Tax=Sitodiplosis mosellana TaxID=263140 RepID=UPI002443BE5E|nr:uncharacterized protein LOC129575838 [Sitodiplosis mosellana]